MKRIISLIVLCFACASCFAQVTNTSGSPLPLATYTAATVNSPDQLNYNYRGAHIIINVVTVTSGTYTPHIQAKDPISGLYYDLLVGTAISASGVTVLKVYPGIATLSNGSASDILPSVWRVQLIGASTPSMVLSVWSDLEL